MVEVEEPVQIGLGEPRLRSGEAQVARGGRQPRHRGLEAGSVGRLERPDGDGGAVRESQAGPVRHGRSVPE